ncbi:MAG: HAMP domain-containing methyl-accepting chemotaxis protein [Myxococcota bacterium]
MSESLQPLGAKPESSVDVRLRYRERLSTRVVLLQLALVAAVLVFTSWRFHSQQLQESRERLKEAGETLLPFMVPSIRPVLDFAVDITTGRVDEGLVQAHIVEAVFDIAKKNRDLVYVDLVLQGRHRIATFLAPGMTLARVDALFAQADMRSGTARVTSGDLIGFAQSVVGPDGKTRLGEVRVAHSLQRVSERARAELLATTAIGLVIFVVIALLTLGLGHLLIYAPLQALLQAVQSIAAGRLVTPIGSHASGELGLLATAVREMAGDLRGIVMHIQETSSDVARIVGSIAQRSRDSLSGARQQSKALDTISEAINLAEATSRAVDRDAGDLMSAASQVADDISSLSQGMIALEPQVGDFGGFVQQTDGAMQRMASAASTIADNLSSITTATEGVAATVVQFEQSVTRIAGGAEKATALSKHVEQRAEEGAQAVGHSVDGMTQVGSSFSSIAQAIAGLGQSIDAIGRALEIITEVNRRTRLLSLNAAILAEQAGEHGQAFVVVADEIKALSDRTKISTAEIGETLAALESGRAATSTAMAVGLTSVQEGQRRAENAGEAIRSILDLSRQSHGQIADIARATQEQAQGSRQITSSVTRIAEMARTMGSASREQKQSADSITSMTARMVKNLATVQAVIRKEVGASVRTADQIRRVLDIAGLIRDQSSAQKKAAVGAVTSVAGVRSFASEVVAMAEAVAAESAELSQRTVALRDGISHFEVISDGIKPARVRFPAVGAAPPASPFETPPPEPRA